MAPTASPPRRLSAPARREQLLDVATDLVVEQSFHAVSVEAVARRAGITRAVIYQHFGDLPGLLEAVIARETQRARAQVAQTALPDLTEGEPRALMLQSLRAYLHLVHEHPTTWRLVLMPPEGAPELLRQSIARGRGAVLSDLTRAVRPALRRDPGSPDAELTARVLSAISDEYARLVLTDPVRYSPERLLEHARWYISQLAL